ncbi:MAG: hypothetical protein ISR65_18855 [Bacteriovoracaceae bacterium]|nr:hypothetical protein [Bacteriovoracaceae bacterium]
MYCKLLHEANESAIKKKISNNGGYIAHFDGTTEAQVGDIALAVMDSISGHILYSEMVKSEKEATIKTALDEVVSKYGIPLMSVSDCKSGFLSACKRSLGSIYHLYCHFHFCRTFKKYFIKDHSDLKKILGQGLKVKSKISETIKKIILTKRNKKEFKTLDDIKREWKASRDIKNTYLYTLRWVLKFKNDSSGKGVPFDLPYLDLYSRVYLANAFLNKILKNKDRIESFEIIKKIVCEMDSEKHLSIHKKIKSLKYKWSWFNKLRASLYMSSIDNDEDDYISPLSKRYNLSDDEIDKIDGNLKSYCDELTKEISSDHCTEEELETLTSFKSQTEKYQSNLSIPRLETRTASKRKHIYIPQRTNNILETFFRSVKTILRRITGRSKITLEFNSVGHLLPYYLNMRTHPQFEQIFMTEENMVTAFSKLHSSTNFDPINVTGISKISKTNYDELDDLDDILIKSNALL